MNILGIETSCDETAAAVVKDGKTILASSVISSLKEHQKFGGVIPEIASRHHLESISAIVEKALSESKLSFNQINAVAVAKSPGLIGSLLVGLSFARALSFALKIPLIEVNHIQAHLYANFLVDPKKGKKPLPKLPAVGLIVSGGHTSLYTIKDFRHFRLLGQTLDDAAGEAFDKTARILDLGYPGGPIIDKLSQDKITDSGIRFSCAKLPGTLDFSFSGIKTAVLYYKQKNHNQPGYSVPNIARAFQYSVVQTLVEKSMAACTKTKSKILLIGGGVAANSELRKKLLAAGDKNGVKVFIPDLPFCMDNAAMIAGLAYHLRDHSGIKK